MGILIVSPDRDAGHALCSALKRSDQHASWYPDSAEAKRNARADPPSVLVTDSSLGDYQKLVSEMKTTSPWTRVYVMVDPGDQDAHEGPVVVKPFHAMELAQVLSRERELAELEYKRQALQTQASELSLLVEASFEAIIGLSAEGLILSWNRGAESIYGYRADEIIGRRVDFLEKESAGVLERLATARGEPMEVRRVRKDGTEIVVLLSLSPLERSHRSLAFAETSLDITERRKLERELEHAERLAAIGRLAASMAHEINNPLAVIRASNSYSAEVAGGLKDPLLTENVEDVELAVERIGSFVQHVCGFARRDRPKLEDASLSETAEMSLRMVRPRAKERGVSLTLQADSGLRVPHDPPRISQAIVNIVSNAVDAAAQGGRNVDIRLELGDSEARVIVDDDGPGIEEAIRERVFEPFTTTKPQGQGTGLGLAITRQILQDHGGSVQLSPRDGGGTRAELCLPALEASAHSILVIEANSSVRRALRAELTREGFHVHDAAGLEQAKAILAQNAFRVILADSALVESELIALTSPAGDGRRARVLLLSADPGPTPPGADDVLGKPWERERLITSVRQLCL